MACHPAQKKTRNFPKALQQLPNWVNGGRLGWDSLSGLQRAHAGFWEAFRNTGNNSIF